MIILAHRGYWKSVEEKNSTNSLKKAIEKGYGIETDIRDYTEQLVISHNMACESCDRLEELFKYYDTVKSKCWLALNVKADGIQSLIKHLLIKYNISKYFLFDMSIPEMVVDEKEKLEFFTRHSDIEETCVLYERASGVWLDSFYKSDWLEPQILDRHLTSGKKICIVSPEIHGWDPINLWKILKSERYHLKENIMLCTDIPDEARRYFEIGD